MTREEQIDWLCRLKADLNNGVIFTPWNKEFTEALTGILEQKSEWIPVSERLPDNQKRCLVTFEAKYTDIMCYAQDLYRVDEYDFCDQKGKAGWYVYDSEYGYYSRDDVIAWMPLPQPYRSESEDKE